MTAEKPETKTESQGESKSGGNSGVQYITSKEGIVRAVIIVFGCIAFALIADVGYGDVIAWVMAAYIIAWVFTLLSYFFIATTLSTQMNCGISYETVDVCVSIVSFFHCLMASIVLAIYTCSRCDELIAADVFGFLLCIAYAVEIYFLKGNAPSSLKYLLEIKGILKAVICIFGCTTFAMLDAAGYECFESGCDSGRTWAFAAYIYCWVVSLIILLLRVTPLADKISPIDKIDFFWSVFSFFNYLAASIVLACYLECKNFEYRVCSTRLAADIFGFITAILYAVEAFLLKGACTNGVSPG
ncbi:myeloid-associated differentiation marker-like protein 2 [Clavelina lepadiformis]|uniref:myeloid-associated differentiation marker-like protein 2 n=1 Tax=Clavelina lepadiformis TaxID=159417 RepID=UPI004041DB45